MSHQVRIVLKDRTTPKKGVLRQGSSQNMIDAYNDVIEGTFTISKAARVYQVPRKTLSDRVNGNVAVDCRMGPSTALSKEEEESLVKYIEYMASRGFPLTVDQISSYA